MPLKKIIIPDMPLSVTQVTPHVIETLMAYTGLLKIVMAYEGLPPTYKK
jgi:hypothetical protein